MKKGFVERIFSVPYKGFFLSCLAINLTVLLLILFLQEKIPPVVPLLYQLPIGEEQLVPKIFLIVPSLTAMVIIATNMFLLKISEDNFVHRVLVGLSIAATLLAVITSIKIFFLVASF